MYRAGIRGGIPKFIQAGRAKFAKVWCGRNHPLYREIEASDTLMQYRMPGELTPLVQSAMSLNQTGKPFTAEGADFRLEEINKPVQHWLPNIPTANDWKVT